jgi:hypothetical protein
MIIIVPVSRYEFEKTLNMFGFLKALRHFGPYRNHQLLVVSRPTDKIFAKSIFDLSKDLFSKSSLHVFETDGESGWPLGPNFYWKETIKHLKESKNKHPWFWMELDVIPLKPKWADILEKEYNLKKKPYMGMLQDTTTTTMDNVQINIAKHLQGTAVYPHNIHEICDIWEYVDKIKIAFDVICQWQIAPNTHDTDLIQQGFRTINYKILENPLMIKGEDNGDYKGITRYDDPINPNAVVHHGCKDDTLANIVTSPTYDIFLK